MARRVALAAGGSAALGAVIAAALCIFVIDRVLTSQVDQRLQAAAFILVDELDEEREEEGDDDDALADVLDDENEELVHSGVRLALYEGRELVAGDPWVPRAGGVRCVSRGAIGSRIRACGTDYGDYRAVAAQRLDDDGLSVAYLSAGLVAVLLAALLGGICSLWLVRLALGPLALFVARVRELSGAEPDPAALGGPLALVELEALRRALAESLARTRAHLAHVERFSADAAHELLTPLSILQAELDLLAEDSEGDLATRVRALGQRTQTVTELVRRLLVLTTPGQIERELPLVAMATIVEDVLQGLAAPERTRVRFEDASEGLLRGDEALLRSLVHNLLDNAFKYTDGEVQVSVLDAANQGDAPSRVRVDVRDFGPGLGEDARVRAFEPFFRAGSGKPGHGLGLALVRRIAEAHGGTVELLPAEPGLVVRVWLPA
jgi:signal transduction histidine kinase